MFLLALCYHHSGSYLSVWSVQESRHRGSVRTSSHSPAHSKDGYRQSRSRSRSRSRSKSRLDVHLFSCIAKLSLIVISFYNKVKHVSLHRSRSHRSSRKHYSRSRSRSHRRRSRSRSRSWRRRRSHSRSPMSNRRRHIGNRVCIQCSFHTR